MNLHNRYKYAILGACALGIVSFAGTASAQVAYEFEAGIPETISITGTVENSIDADVTAPTLGTFGALRSAASGENGILELTPAGAINTTADGDANMVEGTGAAAGIVAISGAFPATQINVTYSSPVDLTCGACVAPGNPSLQLVEVTDDLTTPAVLDVLTPANTVTGNEVTDGSGNLTFNIGLTIRTTVGPEPYESGTYAGSFDAMIQY